MCQCPCFSTVFHFRPKESTAKIGFELLKTCGNAPSYGMTKWVLMPGTLEQGGIENGASSGGIWTWSKNNPRLKSPRNGDDYYRKLYIHRMNIDCYCSK